MKKYGYSEKRTLTMENLRNLCVFNNWYTNGSNKEYENLLNNVDNLINITTDDIVEIATDILSHSNLELDELTNICFKINEACNTFFIEDL